MTSVPQSRKNQDQGQSHWVNLREYGRGDYIVNGSMHGRWDKAYYVQNGVGSVLNSSSDVDCNCRLVCFPQKLGAFDYALVEEGQPLPLDQMQLWVLLQAKRDIEADEELKWNYSVFPTLGAEGGSTESSQTSQEQA